MRLLLQVAVAGLVLLGLAAPPSALAGTSDVELHELGTPGQFEYRLKNHSRDAWYMVEVEIARLDLNTRQVISKRTGIYKLGPGQEQYLGPEKDTTAAFRYKITSIRVSPRPEPGRVYRPPVVR